MRYASNQWANKTNKQTKNDVHIRTAETSLSGSVPTCHKSRILYTTWRNRTSDLRSIKLTPTCASLSLYVSICPVNAVSYVYFGLSPAQTLLLAFSSLISIVDGYEDCSVTKQFWFSPGPQLDHSRSEEKLFIAEDFCAFRTQPPGHT